MSKSSYVYLLTNKLVTVFYLGVTSDLLKRMWQHKNKSHDGFTKKYNCDKLVYYECHDNIREAILREKKLKNWHRAWKINLVQKSNPEFKDLSEEIGLKL